LFDAFESKIATATLDEWDRALDECQPEAQVGVSDAVALVPAVRVGRQGKVGCQDSFFLKRIQQRGERPGR
jgi:hypothetical protein